MMGLASAGGAASWTGFGALVVFGLFIGYSVPFMDDRLKRYPDWEAYVKVTSSFLPMPPLKSAKTD